MNQKRRTILIILSVGAILGLFGWAVFSSLRHRGETMVKIIVVPEDSKITVDGAQSKSGTVYLKPGKHEIKASRQYFTDVTKNVDTKDLKSGQEIYLLPGIDSPEAIKWLNDHPEVQEMREAVGGAQAAANSETIAEKYPFITNLPYRTLDFQVDYSITGEKYDISFQVTLNPVAVIPGTPEYKQQVVEYKQLALEYLESQGVDTKKAKISFDPDPERL